LFQAFQKCIWYFSTTFRNKVILKKLGGLIGIARTLCWGPGKGNVTKDLFLFFSGFCFDLLVALNKKKRIKLHKREIDGVFRSLQKVLAAFQLV